MKLIVEPDHGVAPLLSAIKKARRSIEIAIFRFDHSDIESALRSAASNGVKVTALIAYSNRGGEKKLRQLEERFLDAGILVARSAADLTRYHGKIMVIDRRVLCLFSFNYTHLDIDCSRGFGIVTKDGKWIQEAVNLLECDCTRRPYVSPLDSFVVSPANSRKVLGSFLKRARKQLLIYDPQISDKEMIGILQHRAKAGVEVRVIGRVDGSPNLPVGKLPKMRLHTRVIIRDRRQAFVGSQSLRSAELDSRREVGLIVREPQIVKGLIDIFETDWKSTDTARQAAEEAAPKAAQKETDKTAQVLVEEMKPVTMTVKRAVKKVAARAGEAVLEDNMVKDTVKKVVKAAVKEAVKEVVQNNKDA